FIPIMTYVAQFPRPSDEIKINGTRVEPIREDPSLALCPGCNFVVLKCDYQEIMLVAREFSSFARRDCNGKNADIVVFEQQTMMRLSRDLDQNLLLRRQHAGQHDKQGGALHE